MILSQTAVYALKAVLHLAEGHDGPVRVDDIAEQLDVPRNYLSKILHVLARAGVLDSTRGPKGGFEIAVSPATLALSEVISHFDQPAGSLGCLLGREECSDSDPCPAHGRWKDVSRAMKTFFQETTVADLARRERTEAAAPLSSPSS